MTHILKSIHKAEVKFDAAAERFLCRHLFFGYLAIFIGMPALILAVVLACTMALALPFAQIFGWL